MNRWLLLGLMLLVAVGLNQACGDPVMGEETQTESTQEATTSEPKPNETPNEGNSTQEPSSPEPAPEETNEPISGDESIAKPEPKNESNPEPGKVESTNEPSPRQDAGPNDSATSEPSPPESSPDQTNQGACQQTPKTYKFGNDTVTLSCQTKTDGLRSYTLRTTHPLRDNDPPSMKVDFEEKPGLQSIRMRSGNLLLDALFAMSIHENVQLSVNQIREGAFNNNKPIPCKCYQTGAKWTYAWTRDTAYAVDLGLASLDPERSMNTLLFKTSNRKATAGGGKPQIVQDTGTGGSWPVSSDRVVWALSAWQLVHFLKPADKTSFIQKSFPALENTILLDRKMIYDRIDGLYRGEQSFLDWREQTYPSWTKNSLWHIAMSKALSTNVNHLIALEVAGKMAKQLNKTTEAQKYETWAKSLRNSIHSKFYIASEGLYSTMLTTTMDQSATYKFDLLGNALAILWGVADSQTAAKVVSSYTHSDKGPPVVWPQQPFTAVYHNRGIWPFVTAYWIRAGVLAQNSKVVNLNLESMIRGAALNLSNMENFEFLTGANYHQDGAYSGPVVNSRRQLWSVAGYLSAMQDVMFGLQVGESGIRFLPFVPREFRKKWITANQYTLEDFKYKGKIIKVVVNLPTFSQNQEGSYRITGIKLNGSNIGNVWIKDSQLLANNTISISLANPTSTPTESIKVVTNNKDFRLFWSPKEPQITKLNLVGGKVQLTISSNGETGVTHSIYKDGVRVASNVAAGTWTDPNSGNQDSESPCYAVDSVYTSSNNRSHHSPPTCWNGANNDRAEFLPIHRFAAEGGSWGKGGTNDTYIKWGNGNDSMEVASYVPSWTGDSYFQFKYRNPHGGITTGIACSTKRVRVWNKATNKLVGEGYVVMPHTASQNEGWSSYLSVKLDASQTYRIRVDNDSIVHNMTYLDHFRIYTAGAGGGTSIFNQVEIQGLRVFHKKGTAANRTTGKMVLFNGTNDLNKLNTKQVVTPGITLETWERFGLTWDKDWIYIAVVSKGFRQDLKPFNLYIQAGGASLPVAQSSTGLNYLNQTANLPFTPTHMVGVRQKTDANDGFGPWNGVWKNTSGKWSLQTRFQSGVDFWVAGDKHTVAYKIHRAELGWPKTLRLSGHFVNAIPSNEWKVVVPKSHTPWKTSSQGYLELSLGSSTDSSKWLIK